MQTRPIEMLPCDGCGLSADPQHMARRLQRLEWSTRYRPIHIGTLLLGGISPQRDADFLYAGAFEGEAGRVVEAVGIEPAGKSPESVLGEFQRGGFFLAHLIECPMDGAQGGRPSWEALLPQRVPLVLARIRRSLKPKKVVLISEMLASLLGKFSSSELGCPVLLDAGNPFALDSGSLDATRHLRKALASGAGG